MYKESRFKIVITIMAVLTLFFTATISAIYISSYISVHKTNTEMLQYYVDTYWKKGSPEGTLQNLPLKHETTKDDDHRYKLSFFYSVAFASDGSVITVDNEMQDIISDDYFISLGKLLIENGQSIGTNQKWMYHVATNKGVTLVAFKNNEILDDDMATLLYNTLFWGTVAILLLILPSIYLSRGIVRPLEISHMKQKQFITNASHDLKTPLAVMLTNAEMLETEIGENKWLNYIKYEAQIMSQLVNKMLELSHSEDVGARLTRQDLSRIVLGRALSFESVAFEKNKLLEIDIQEALYILGNEEELTNLVTILLDNALEYSPEQRTIRISLTQERYMIYLLISNESSPLSSTELEKLFDRFFRMEDSRTSNNHFGLGLSIAKAIVEGHHGKIHASYENDRVLIKTEFQSVN